MSLLSQQKDLTSMANARAVPDSLSPHRLVPSQAIRPSGQLIVCQRRIQTNAPIVNWQDNPQFNAYQRSCYRGPDGQSGWQDPRPFRPALGLENRTARFRPRKELMGHSDDLTILQHVIRQLVVHHDGADSARDCFHILHDERGLSAHFLIDTDGTVYQTLDLADIAFHAQSVNGVSIGVELCNRGLVSLPASLGHRRSREPQLAVVHGRSYTMWSFTDAQYISLTELYAQLAQLFPRLPLHAPYAGGPIQTALAQPERYSGILGHYHVSAQKWDPGCFDFGRVLSKVAGRRRFALSCGSNPADWAPPEARELFAPLTSHGSYFPVGRCGSELVWHGGVHLRGGYRSPVSALWPGRIVAARLHRRPHAFGSSNFVLTRHELKVGAGSVVFFILYYHLAAFATTEESPVWIRNKRAEDARNQALPGLDVSFPDVDVLAGEHLGNLGLAGPPNQHTGQLHLQVFSVDEISVRLFPGQFQIRDCVGQGPLCVDPVISALASTSSGQSPSSAGELRRHALRFPSEWQSLPAAEFDRRLRLSQQYSRVGSAARASIYCEQVQPAAWLDARVAKQLGLPQDFRVWHYHPTEFLSLLCSEFGRIAATDGPHAFAPDVVQSASVIAVDDGAKADLGYASEEDLTEWELGQGIELSTLELARGYPDSWLR